MKFPSIRIEGSIFSSDILEKIEQSEIPGQLSKDFGFEFNVKVKDEIAIAWADANSYWKVFKGRVDSLKEGDSGTSETRKFWIVPFLGLLGYEIENYKSAQVISGKNYAISHFASNLDNFPVHIMGVNDSLDKKRVSGGPRMSPHSLLQEYINLTEHLYAILSNGMTLRLLRDSSRLVKLSYIEFDLEKMFEEDQFTDFAVLFRLLHSSRMPSNKESASESLIERYHLDALESGERIRSGLSLAVENSIKQFGTGFLNNPANKELINAIESDLRRDVACNVSAKELFHSNLLRLIYRILFLMVIEERGLVYPEKSDKNLKEIYYNYYSVSSIRKISELKYLSNGRFNNLWIQLKNTFLLFENEHSGKALGLKPLAGDLFGERAIELLRNCDLENKYLLECLNNLNFYKNEKGQQFRVNYAALSVEEFGSVYEGLLEFKPVIQKTNGKYDYSFGRGDERSKSGSHYTPDELVQPLIKHSLDYIIEDRLKEKDKEKALLSITVLDISCGSGHILLNAARRIAIELAKARSGEDQPNPSEYRKALKDVIKNCIYGVDKNPLAVELCKVALWLESHIPGEPLNFLDHKIKCGDSIVGLAHKEELEKGIPTEAFNAISGDDKGLASELRRTNKSETLNRGQIKIEFINSINSNLIDISDKIARIKNLSQDTPEEVEIVKKKYEELKSDNNLWNLSLLADIQTAQFFIPKIPENRDKLITDSSYREQFDKKQLLGDFVYAAMEVSQKKKFFHWFLEFPEVFLQGGFDCVLSNPPYLGGQKISGAFGEAYLEFLKNKYEIVGSCDLVNYFLRNIYQLIKADGFLALITTKSISEGVNREGGLDIIIENKGSINFVIRSTKWPGQAKLQVALLSLYKGIWLKDKFLDNEKVSYISPYFDSQNIKFIPSKLICNKNKIFIGSNFLGDGFILTETIKNSFINADKKNNDIIFSVINGDDINNNPKQESKRYIINFFDYDLIKASSFNLPFKRIEELVYPERQKQNRDSRKKYWWHYGEKTIDLYNRLKKIDSCFVVALTTRYLSYSSISSNHVFTHATAVLTENSFYIFAFLQSTLHFEWSQKLSSGLGNTMRYTPSDCFETFPFSQNISSQLEQQLEFIGEAYHEHRKQLMLEMHLGLTKTYNQFHNKYLSQFRDENFSAETLHATSLQEEDHIPGIFSQNSDLKEIEKKYGKETVNLIKHFKKGEPKISLAEAIEGIEKLRQLHVEMDNAVLEAYGWQDIELRHDFYEVDYLPENDRVRFTIHPEARREILKRLLELNHKIHEEEVKAGLWGKKKTKSKKKADVVREPVAGYGLFDKLKKGE